MIRLSLLAVLIAGAAPAQSFGLFQIRALANGAVEFTSGSATIELRPEFTILHAAADPKLAYAFSKPEIYHVPSWNVRGGAGRTMDLFTAGDAVSVAGRVASRTDREIRWRFPERGDFRLEASVSFPDGGAEPVIALRFTALQEGWYSIGYTGMPRTSPADADALWQPVIWQDKRFPRLPFLSSENICSLPAAFVSKSGLTWGLTADSSQIEFRLPTLADSRFGVALRTRDGEAAPMIFAPVLGGLGSRMEARQTFEFRLRPVLVKGGCYEAFRHTGRALYGFHDYRHNLDISLNDTLSNMIDFAMNDAYSGWNADLRGFDYTLDVPGTVKVVSALHPLSLAIVRDDPEIYRRRALPMIEYMLSREKYLFALWPGAKGQNASHAMNGPCAEVSELAALYLMSRKRAPVFRRLAETLSGKSRRLNLEMVSEGGSWQNMLALYRMTGNSEYLEKARRGAAEYVEHRVDRPQTDFSDVHIESGGQFWTDFAPKWIDLVELYEQTRDKRFLNAAAKGARLYANYCWLQPPIPDRNVLVNPGGLAPLTDFRRNIPDPQQMHAPEHNVPAWTVSQAGLTPEAANTAIGNPAVMLTHYAAYFLRIAYYTGDTFFRDLARSAVIGRYRNFPGYDINVAYSDVYQRAGYPLRPFNRLTYNNIYYNHVWPHIALLVDYLVSDAFTRSKEQISFPSRYAQGYAYLQSKVYGDRPGVFYGDTGVRFWMPRDVVRIGDSELNYVSGYGNGNFYVGLMNESDRPVSTTLALNSDYVLFDPGKRYRVRLWEDGRSATDAVAVDGRIRVNVSAKGLTALAVDQVPVFTRLQRDYFDASSAPLPQDSYGASNTPAGRIEWMLLSIGEPYVSAYVWLHATEKDLREARLVYNIGGKEKTLVDSSYPFEFSVPFRADSASMRFHVDATTTTGQALRTETWELPR
jgi:hypothetical protein